MDPVGESQTPTQVTEQLCGGVKRGLPEDADEQASLGTMSLQRTY